MSTPLPSTGLPEYAELFCLSNFSFLQGASHAEELVARAVQLDYAALAITDECSLAGVVRAHVAARDVAAPYAPGRSAVSRLYSSRHRRSAAGARCIMPRFLADRSARRSRRTGPARSGGGPPIGSSRERQKEPNLELTR